MTGYTMMALGRWLEAADVLEQSLETQLKPLEDDDAEHARSQLKKVLEHVAVVTVTSRVAGARVSIDSGPQREVPATVRLEPGEHSFVVTARGLEPASETQELGAGERTTLTLDPRKRGIKGPPPKPKPGPRPEPEASSTSYGWFPGQGVVGLVTAGVGIVAGGVALGTGIYGLTLRDSVDENIEAHKLQYDPQCTNHSELCRYDIELINRDGERAADYQNAAMVTGIVGVVLVAGGLTLFFMSDSDGMNLETACVPSSVEMCFDALDNNCNGVIDEGCGLHTGILQFTIAWPEAAAEVDLTVTGPDGDEAQTDKPTTAGLLKDRDCPGTENQCFGQNVENVFLAEGRPRSGRYRAVVLLRDPGEASPPIKVRFSARVGQRHFTSMILLKDRDEQREFEFTL
jgi:tRNA (guanosine-2'-O-)-methyltransferase